MFFNNSFKKKKKLTNKNISQSRRNELREFKWESIYNYGIVFFFKSSAKLNLLFTFKRGTYIFGKKMWHILDLEKVLDHDNYDYAFASRARHLFLPQNTNKIK